MKLVEPEPKKAIGHRLPGEEHGAKAGSLVDYFKSLGRKMGDYMDGRADVIRLREVE